MGLEGCVAALGGRLRVTDKQFDRICKRHDVDPDSEELISTLLDMGWIRGRAIGAIYNTKGERKGRWKELME